LTSLYHLEMKMIDLWLSST